MIEKLFSDVVCLWDTYVSRSRRCPPVKSVEPKRNFSISQILVGVIDDGAKDWATLGVRRISRAGKEAYYKVCCVVNNDNEPKYYGAYVSEDGSTIAKKNVLLCAPYDDDILADLLQRHFCAEIRLMASGILFALKESYSAKVHKNRQIVHIGLLF
jgi:hypothetical protein